MSIKTKKHVEWSNECLFIQKTPFKKFQKFPNPKLPHPGLSLMFNLEQKDYIGELTESAGLRLVVHDPRRMAFPEDEGILVAPNTLTNIGISMVRNLTYVWCFISAI